jgi:CRISPR system Cascade subunit CasC
VPRTIVDIHIIQTVPPSNLNRDDTGSPKTAVYGGKRRARVSSQAWKRATRADFDRTLDRSELGVRSKRLVELIGTAICGQAPSLADRSQSLAEDVLKAAGIKTAPPRKAKADAPAPGESGYLIFLSRRQIENLAELAVTAASEAGNNAVTIDKAEARRRANQDHSIDISLFGRMVAEIRDLDVDASAQVAHALSVHAVDNEYDYFTAVDDHKHEDTEEDAGAAMIGTVEFNSSTLYRYATIDVDRLHDNLGDIEAARRGVEAFVRSFVSSMPTGKQNTFANRTLPDGVVVTVRDTQPINFVGAFEEAVADGEDGGRIAASCRRLAQYGKEIHNAYGETPVTSWSIGVGERAEPLTELGPRSSLATVVEQLGVLVAERTGTP